MKLCHVDHIPFVLHGFGTAMTFHPVYTMIRITQPNLLKNQYSNSLGWKICGANSSLKS